MTLDRYTTIGVYIAIYNGYAWLSFSWIYCLDVSPYWKTQTPLFQDNMLIGYCIKYFVYCRYYTILQSHPKCGMQKLSADSHILHANF